MEKEIQTYLVGGAVRDEIMGRIPKDRDWVVVGVEPEDMIKRGFRSVGIDFPVFLHPQTNEEHALARKHRHSNASSLFSLVTLEEDLFRRDLTMNAIAKSINGSYIDPYGGLKDIKDGVFRHINESFCEDPVRILRVARLAARYPNFTVAPETFALMAYMVSKGCIDELVPERVYKEISRGLEEVKPSRMLNVLRQCGALARLLPELDCLYGVPAPAQWHPEIDTGIHIEMVVDHAAKTGAPLGVRLAAFLHDLGKGLTEKAVLPHHPAHEIRGVPLVDAVCRRMKVPNNLRELACLVAKEHGNVHACLSFGPKPLAYLLERCDAVKQPIRFDQMLMACECDARGRLGLENRDYFQVDVLREALDVVLAVDQKAVVSRGLARGLAGPALSEEIRLARLAALKAHYKMEVSGKRPGAHRPSF